MPDVWEVRLRIGGTDYGQAGAGLLTRGGRIEAGSLLHIGTADLLLEGPPGVDADIRNQAYVEWYFYNVTANRVPRNGRLFCGFVARRGTGQNPGTTEKRWSLPCQDINLLWDSLVARTESAQTIRIPAGTFGAQIEALFAAFAGGVATRSVLADSTHVLNLTGSAILPPLEFAGPTLRDMIGVIFTNARRVNPLLRPTATITPDPEIGGVGADSFGSPVLWVWDLASPPSPAVYYTTGTPDSTHFAILGTFERALESPRFANWGQAQDAAGRVYTSAHALSLATYPPNPFDPDGVWKRPAVRDTQHSAPTANATGTASVSGGAVTGVTVNLNGTGYTEAPTVVFAGGGGSGAAARANMYGYLLTLALTNGGSGYSEPPTASLSGGGGSGAAAAVTVAAGHVTALTVTSPGSGYTSAPTVTINGGGGTGATVTATVSGGAVTGFTVTAGGSGYVTPVTVSFSGGGGTGAAARATLSNGAVSALTITNPGNNYTSAPTLTISGGGGSGATGTATVGGRVLSVTMLAGGAGYATAPTVSFSNAIQSALDAAVEQTALPRETIPITSRVPTLPGTYAGLTLTLEAGIVETAYPVSSLTVDLTNTADPIYTMQLGSRRLRLGETDSAGDVYAAPVEGVRLNPPTNWAQTSAFQPNLGNTFVYYTFDPPVPPPGMSLERYDLHVKVDETWYTTSYPGNLPGVLVNPVNPGSTLEAYLVAIGRAGTRLVESFPTPTLGPFTAAAAWDPDPPTALAVAKSGIERGGTNGYAILQFTPPGTTHGPHDQYEVDVYAGGVLVNTLFYTDPGGTPTVLPPIHNLTLGVLYSFYVRTIAAPRWLGTRYAGPVTVRVSSGAPPPTSGFTAGDRLLEGWTPSDEAAVTLPGDLTYQGGVPWALTVTGGTPTDLTADDQAVTPGQVLRYKLGAAAYVWGALVDAGGAHLTDSAGAYLTGAGTTAPGAGALTSTVDFAWYDAAAAWLSTDSIDLGDLDAPDNWSYVEGTVTAPMDAKTLRTTITAAGVGVLLLVLLAAPAPQATAVDYGAQSVPSAALNVDSITFRDLGTGDPTNTVTVNPVTGAATFENQVDPSGGSLIGRSTNGNAVSGLDDGDFEGGGTGIFGSGDMGVVGQGLSIGVSGGAAGDGTGTGVAGTSTSGAGVVGGSGSGAGVFGTSTSGRSALFRSSSGSNSAATVVIQRRGSSTANLLEIRDDDNTLLAYIDYQGNIHGANFP